MRTLLKTAFRNIRSNKTYSFFNITGLAVGIACASLIFLWVSDEIAYDAFNAKKDRLYCVKVNSSFGENKFTMGSTPLLMASSIKAEIPGIANTCRISDGGVNALFSVNGNAMYASGLYTDPSLFNMFTFSFVEGNAGKPYSQLNTIVIPEKTVKKFFGNAQNVIGRTVRMNNGLGYLNYVISGVVKDMPANSTLQFEWLAPYRSLLQQTFQQSGNYNDKWNSYGPFTYVELASSANVRAINQKLFNYIHGKDATQKNTAFLYPMGRWHLYNQFANQKETGSGLIRQVKLLSVIASVILLIACINFMNLATARSEKRAKEIGVRKVLGSGRSRLLLQFIAESMLMSAMATILALGIMALVLPSFNMLIQKDLSHGLDNPVHIGALLFITFICGLLAGSYPAFYLSAFEPVKALKGLKIKSGSAALIRKGLVVLQFSVSVVFIISTIVIYLQIQHVKDRNMGFDKYNLVEIDMQHDISKTFPIVKQELLNTGLVQNVAMSDHSTIYGGNSDDSFKWEGKQANNKLLITVRTVTPEFIPTSGMNIVEGKDFSGVPADTTTAIVTRSLANIIDKNGVVGKTIQSGFGMKNGTYRNLRIVGVVNDYVFGNVYNQAGAPAIFLCSGAEGSYNHLVYARFREGHLSQHALSTLGAVITKNNPAYPFQYKFVDDQFNELFASEVQMSRLSGIFAALAIVISCFGLFSLAAYTAERRIKEIGIRKVLGASVTGLAWLLSKDFLQLVGISCLVAFPVTWYLMHQWLQNYEYRISIHWWIFAAAGLSAMLIALATVCFQAMKAALANPVNSLRSE